MDKLWRDRINTEYGGNDDRQEERGGVVSLPRVTWFRKSGAKSEDRARPQRIVTIDGRSLALSQALRKELGAEDGQPLYIMVGVRRGNLALAKGNPNEETAWRVNAKTGRTNNRQLLAHLAEKGITPGRYVMEWNGRAQCYVAKERLELQTRRRRTAQPEAQAS